MDHNKLYQSDNEDVLYTTRKEDEQCTDWLYNLNSYNAKDDFSSQRDQSGFCVEKLMKYIESAGVSNPLGETESESQFNELNANTGNQYSVLEDQSAVQIEETLTVVVASPSQPTGVERENTNNNLPAIEAFAEKVEHTVRHEVNQPTAGSSATFGDSKTKRKTTKNNDIKVKKYMQPPSKDRKEEKKRQNAIKAKLHRVGKKNELDSLKQLIIDKNLIIQDLTSQLEANKKEKELTKMLDAQKQHTLESVHQLVKGYGNICN